MKPHPKGHNKRLMTLTEDTVINIAGKKYRISPVIPSNKTISIGELVLDRYDGTYAFVEDKTELYVTLRLNVVAEGLIPYDRIYKLILIENGKRR